MKSLKYLAGVVALATSLVVNAQTWTPVEWQSAGSDTASAEFSKKFLPSIEEAVANNKFDPALFTEVKGLDSVKPSESVRVYFVSGEKGPDAWKGYRALFNSDGTFLGASYTHTDENAAKVVSGDYAEFAGSDKATYQEGGFAAAGGGTGAEWWGTSYGITAYNATVYEMIGTGLSILNFTMNGANMALVFTTGVTTPEPETYAILAGCVGLGAWMTRRKRSSATAAA